MTQVAQAAPPVPAVPEALVPTAGQVFLVGHVSVVAASSTTFGPVAQGAFAVSVVSGILALLLGGEFAVRQSVGQRLGAPLLVTLVANLLALLAGLVVVALCVSP